MSTRLESVNGWQISKRGNKWRKAGRLTATVFRTRAGFTWCLADADGPTYADTCWDTERAAIAACESEIVRRDLLLESLL